MTVSKIRLPDNTEHDIRAKYLIQSTSADAVSEEFVTKTTTEDAIVNIQKIYGNTYKFLQAAQSETANTLVTQDTSVTTEHKYISNSTTTSSSRAVYFNGSTIPDGHVTLLVGILKSDYTNAPYYRIRRGSGSYESISLTGYQQNTWITTIQRDTAGFMGGSNSGIMANGNNYIQGKYISLPNDGGFAAYDLTYMFGAGSEPSTDDFLALFSALVYPYNAGSFLNNRTVSIQSKDSSDNIIGNCDLNIPTLTGKLNGAGSSVIVFQNGMQSNGTTRDELTATSVIKKIADDNSVLSTPQTYILDNALQLQYPVVAGGTEMVMPTSGTAPMKMDVIYGNAADGMANLSQNFISVDSMKEFLAALGTQMNGTWAMQYSGGKYTFTFTSN